MSPEEVQQLAERIARVIAQRGWVPAPVRPAPPGGPTPGQLPSWAGAAQVLGDVAPGRRGPATGRRPAYDALTAAVRGAAAGRAPSPLPGGGGGGSRTPAETSRTVPLAVSNRHIHITQADFEQLFGTGKRPTPERPISQPGQFAAAEKVKVVGPRGTIDGVRIVGPTRSATQVELSASDCRKLGVDAPVRNSGAVEGSAAVGLEGPAGKLDLKQGAIIAARHMHLSPKDAERLGLAGGDRVTVVLGGGDRSATLEGVLVRAGDKHATEIHIDTDEASAFRVQDGDRAAVVGRTSQSSTRQRQANLLVTERDVSAIAAKGGFLSSSSGYVITPSARDRAKALGIWRDNS